MLLRQRDASLVGRGLPQSTGEFDHRHSAERAAGTDPVVRVGSRAGEFLLPDVAAQAPKVRWADNRRVHVHLRHRQVLPRVSARRSRPRIGVWRRNVGYAVNLDRTGARRRIDLVVASWIEAAPGTDRDRDTLRAPRRPKAIARWRRSLPLATTLYNFTDNAIFPPRLSSEEIA